MGVPPWLWKPPIFVHQPSGSLADINWMGNKLSVDQWRPTLVDEKSCEDYTLVMSK